MRIEGTLISWNDERGFGFIRPDSGGPDVFVHIRAFVSNGARPSASQRVAFEIEIGKEGKPRAGYVEIVGSAISSPRQVPPKSPPPSMAALSAIPVFLLLCLWVELNWTLPVLVILGYLLLSIVTFVAYALDKSAAQLGRWRTSESSLQLLAVAGGWPGAVVAQQFLHHKSRKASFQTSFWLMVALNVVGLLLVCWRQEQIFAIFSQLAPSRLLP